MVGVAALVQALALGGEGFLQHVPLPYSCFNVCKNLGLESGGTLDGLPFGHRCSLCCNLSVRRVPTAKL